MQLPAFDISITSAFWGLVIAVPCSIVGFMGTIVPVIPGTAIIFAGFLFYGWMTGFQSLGAGFFAGQVVLVAFSYLVDFWASAWGVRRYGGSKAAARGAFLGSFLVFVIGPAGLVAGPLIGAFLGEWFMGEEMKKALHASLGSFWGFFGGTILKLVIATAMVGWFVSAI
ncbi:MAG TPA: DUF456 family protein [Thermodesulfobacteriaceae bacterium]|nr:DUF456 family protein [Thermodesulfobacteriaceae bacterium]